MQTDNKPAVLFGIGVQKAATSWLYRYFDNHPEVAMPPFKELHYFDAVYAPRYSVISDNAHIERYQNAVGNLNKRNITRNSDYIRRLQALHDRVLAIGDIEHYRRLLFREGQGKAYVGEFTPSYSVIGRKGFRAMAAFHTEVRFLLMFRNPVDRFASHVRFGGRDDAVFDFRSAFYKNLSNRTYTLPTDYKWMLGELVAAVDMDQVNIDFYERLFHQDAIRKLCTWLGISYVAADLSKRVNQGKPAEMTTQMRADAFGILSSAYTAVENHFHGDIPTSWLDDMRQFG